jgi:GNAT superfamily N-acetyltransferase
MEFLQITKENLFYLQTFFALNTFTSFRYFQTRPFDILQQHKYTVLLKVQNELVGYAHIDYENKFWVGICIANQHQGKGYGTKLLNHILQKAKELHISLLHLTVDLDNTHAIQMYKKAGFREMSRTETYMLMEWNKGGIIALPVSYGEAFDKLSILDIKLQKIKDDRAHDVKKEYDMIHHSLHPLFTHDIQYHYDILKHINQTIWEQQDIFRDSHDDTERNRLCVEIIKENDRRFLIKHKINSLLQSALKEQKGYVRRSALLFAHKDAPNLVQAIGTVRYYATLYDKVYVKTTEENKKALEETYADDPSIVVTTEEQPSEPIHSVCESEQATQYFHIANQSRNVAVLTHTGLGDQICAIGMVRWLATKYKNVFIFCHKKYGAVIRIMYPSKNIHVVGWEFDSFYNEELFQICGMRYVESRVVTEHIKEHIVFNGNECDLITTGSYSKKCSPIDKLPFTFYIDAGIDPKLFWNFDIPSLPESLLLYEKIKHLDYIVVQTKTAEGEAFHIHHAAKYYKIDADKTLVIDIEKNFYTPDHPFYITAQEFVHKPIPFYKDILLHAKELYVSDSCLFCLAVNLPLETNTCWIAPRRFSIRLYQYIFDNPNYGFSSKKTKRFRLLWT